MLGERRVGRSPNTSGIARDPRHGGHRYPSMPEDRRMLTHWARYELLDRTAGEGLLHGMENYREELGRREGSLRYGSK